MTEQSEFISLNSVVNMSCATIVCRRKNLGLNQRNEVVAGLVRVNNANT